MGALGSQHFPNGSQAIPKANPQAILISFLLMSAYSLEIRYLTGTLLKQLSKLENLRILDLSGCSFQGSIPKLWRGEVVQTPDWGSYYIIAGGHYYQDEARKTANPNFSALQKLNLANK